MLSQILSKQDCAGCRFCCSYRRTSLWEIPLFTAENIEAIRISHPEYLKELKISEKNGLMCATYDLSDRYKTDDPEEEAPCPFLDPSSGCILTLEEKPFDCKIWPLRALKFSDGRTCIALTKTCRVINRLDFEAVKSFVRENLEKEILLYADRHPFIYKDQSKEVFMSIISPTQDDRRGTWQ